MESPIEIARMAVEALEEGRLDHFCQLVIELENVVGNTQKLKRYLTSAGVGDAYLKRGHEAALQGKSDVAKRFYESACLYVGAEEAAARAEELRFCFAAIVQPVVLVPRVRASLADVN